MSYKKAAEAPRAQTRPDQRGAQTTLELKEDQTREETTSELREDQRGDHVRAQRGPDQRDPPGQSSELREDQTRETPPVRAQSSEKTRPERHSRSERGKRVSSDPCCGAPERSSGHGSAGSAERSYEDRFLQAWLGAPPAAAAAAAAEPPDYSLCRRPAGRILSHPLLILRSEER